jgi:hypothetical protein
MDTDEFANRRVPRREDMRFQRRSWIAERVGWAVLIVLALRFSRWFAFG